MKDGETLTKRNVKPKESSEKTKQEENIKKHAGLRYGPMPRFPHQRVWSRGIIVIGVIIYAWYYSKEGKETVLGPFKDILENRGQQFDCDEGYTKDVSNFIGCVPTKCGRYVSDKLITTREATTLLQMAKQGFSFGGSSGGANIFDIHSGALSLGEKFVNIHSIPEAKKIFVPEHVTTYKIVKEKIQHAIAQLFNIEPGMLHLTHPTFFSKLTSVEAKTKHDEYWHAHVDKVTYESFHYTSLLYLSDYGVDFKGGRFIFQDPAHNITVEPRLGRVSMFTSGAENEHFVERVTEGTRYAITVSFTCDIKHSIKIPAGNN